MRLADLPEFPTGGLYRGVVLHWSAGRYRTWFEHYHFCVLGPRPGGGGDGEIVASSPVRRNLRAIAPGTPYAAHTRGRNSGRLGVSVMAMFGATMADFGAFPSTPRQVETMCAVAGLVDAKYAAHSDLPFEERVLTHYEWAVRDGYYPNRWDWQVLAPEDGRHAPDVLRAKVRWYAERAT